MTDEELLEIYLPVVLPFERHGFSAEEWLRHEGDLHLCLEDFNACLNCDGTVCKAVCNRFEADVYRDSRGEVQVRYAYRRGEQEFRAYHTPSHVGCRERGHPVFVVRQCTSWQERRQECRQIAGVVAARRRRVVAGGEPA